MRYERDSDYAALSAYPAMGVISAGAKGVTDGMRSGEIPQKLGVAQNAVSTQLLKLSRARPVLQPRKGR